MHYAFQIIVHALHKICKTQCVSSHWYKSVVAQDPGGLNLPKCSFKGGRNLMQLVLVWW